MSNDTYVYSLAAVKARFRRGAKRVGFFVPYVGSIVTVTPKNIKRIAADVKQIIAENR